VISRVREWLERFVADEPTPEEIMEIRAREGTLLDDLHDAKEGVKEFLHELTETDEDDYIYACYDNEGLDEIIEAHERHERLMEEMEEEDDLLTNPAYGNILGNIHHDDEYWRWHHDDD